MKAADKHQPRQLGNAGPNVFPVALGCMGMSGVYGYSQEAESIATIHEAIDRGVTLFDTGDFYNMGHNEMLVGRALKGRREKVLLSVKFGAMRAPDGGWLGYDARPLAVKNFLAYSLTRLGVDHIDIYRPARLDPNVPIEDTIGAISELIKAGYVRYAGLSEVGPDTIRKAQSTHSICDLQIEYSLISRGPEKKIFPALRELGIGVTAYGVLSRGLLSGSIPAASGDFRASMPRFSDDNLEQNRKVVETLNKLSAEKGISPSQLAIAWVLAKDKSIVPVMGARTRPQLAETLAVMDVLLSPEELAHLEESIQESDVAGTRYDGHHMKMLDSEK
jgi:aryl-alcohol dehydrogenase-like predicted oxidoreductase